MSLNFCQISPLITELAALESLRNQLCLYFFLLMEMHSILDEFDFLPVLTTDSHIRVSCP